MRGKMVSGQATGRGYGRGGGVLGVRWCQAR